MRDRVRAGTSGVHEAETPTRREQEQLFLALRRGDARVGQALAVADAGRNIRRVPDVCSESTDRSGLFGFQAAVLGPLRIRPGADADRNLLLRLGADLLRWDPWRVHRGDPHAGAEATARGRARAHQFQLSAQACALVPQSEAAVLPGSWRFC